jgi:hypothetical protein
MQIPPQFRNEMARLREQERHRRAQEGQLREEAREANAQSGEESGRRLLIRGALVILALAAIALIVVYYLANR